MAVQTLELKNSLQLRLSQKMQQAIKLLHMSNQELSLFITAYVEGNPLLDMTHEESVCEQDTIIFDDAPANDADPHAAAWEEGSLHTQNDDAYGNTWQEDATSKYRGDAVYDPLEHIAHEQSLHDYLRHQIDIVIEPRQRPLAYILLDRVNDDGYLMHGWEDELKADGLGSNSATVQRLLQKLQTLEPCGVFARSLEECLLLQLKDKGLHTPILEKLLKLLSQHQGSPKELAQKLGVSHEQCQDDLTILRTLNPKPCARIAKDRVEQRIADVLMRRINADTWETELNPVTLPKVYLNSAYYMELKHLLRGKTDHHFLQEKYTEAKWLLKSIHQRAINIIKVTDYIIQKQKDFLRSSKGRLKALTLKEVATALDISESTVSRVTTDKYIETPRGVLELKYFFSVGVNTETAENLHSARSVQSAIASLVQGENREAPLSDNDLVELLKIDGIYIARRTVAKYRAILKIENATERLTYYKWNQGNDKILKISSSAT